MLSKSQQGRIRTMTPRCYVRPIGPIQWARGPLGSADTNDFLRVAGRNDLVCAAAELITRQGSARDLTRALAVSSLRALAIGDPSVAASIMRLETSRPALAGLDLDRPRIMGIVNVTPDSFSDGGRLHSTQAAIEHALQLEANGADILDIGGESTRPGSDLVTVDEELRRVMPVVEGLAGRTKALISIDTRKADVMRRALAAGAHIINDVAALSYEPACIEVAATTNVPVILMHAQGDPRTMQAAPRYDDCLLDVYDWLEARVAACEAAGISRARLVVDPGIGFGKTLDHNLELLAGLTLFHGLGVPVLLGASRKRFIGALTGVQTASDRVAGSVAAALHGAAQGVQILRVHDVAATRQALTIWEASARGIAET